METKKEIKRYLDESYYRIVHPSGLTVIVFPKKDFKSTYAVIGTSFGSIYSSFEFNGKKIHVPDGTAHYLEHKLFESEDGDAFSKYAKTGASANAYTSFDRTCYLFSCTDKLYESLEILIDLVQTPYFTEETVAKEQGIISQEIKMYDDSPDWRVMMNLFQGLYHNNPINIDIAGTVESIAEITPEILYECYNSYYNMHNMTMVIVGDVSVEDIEKLLDEKLRHDEPVETKLLLPEEPYEAVKHYSEQVMTVMIPLFDLGFKEHGKETPVTPKESVCTSIILDAFAGEGSELYNSLMDDKLINSSFGTEYLCGRGYRSIIFSGESNAPKTVAERIRTAIVKLHETGISEEDFEISKRAVYGRIVSLLDSKQAIASELISVEFTKQEVADMTELFRNLTLADVNERLKEQLDPENYCLSVVRGGD